MISSKISLAALVLASTVHGGIVDDGLWTNHDYYNSEYEIGVANGVPYSNDAETTRRIEAAMTVDGDALDYLSKPNVQRVMRLVDEDDWDYLFPIRGDLYEYEGFLHAVGKFEAFCGESNLGDQGYSADDTCARELAALFAHFGQETGLHDEDPAVTGGVEEWRQGLYWVTEIRCTEGLSTQAGTSACDYKQTGFSGNIYPPQPDVQYYGRGPFQLSWNYNYGAFSKVFVESSYNSKMFLLENPDLVHTDAYTVFTSALWFYMTPQSPKPSIHDVMTGFMVPTDADIQAGVTASFGTTTNIINGGHECGKGAETAQSSHRIEYYTAFLDWFDLPEEDASGMSCSNQSVFPTGGYGDAPGYFNQAWDGSAACIPVKWQTGWTIYARDDYKRCVCDFFGDGEADCPQANQADNDDDDSTNDDDSSADGEQDGDESDGGDEDDGDQEDGGDDGQDGDPIVVSDPEAAFDEIHANAHYSATDKSRTLFQVDRSLDFIEVKLREIQAIFERENLIQ